MLKPPPVMPEFAPIPTIVLSDVTLYMPAARLIIPRTQICNGPLWPIAAISSEAVSTSIFGPPAPPVVPFWPHALTLAKPVGEPEVLQVPLGGGLVDCEGIGEPVGGVPGVSVTTRSSKDALA